MPQTFDKQELLDELDGDREFLEESLDMMDADAPKLLKQIRQSVEASDSEAIAKAAHTLKSMVGNFCAPPAHEAALKIEMAARTDDLNTCSQSLDGLETAVTVLRSALRQFLVEIE